MTFPDDAPRLDEWMTPTEIAELLGVSRQTVNVMIRNGEFESLHKIGPETKPQFLVQSEEVEHIRSSRSFPRSPRRLT